MEHATCIFAVLIAVVRGVRFRKRFLQIPVVVSDADGEFEVFFGDGIPVLVDHHDRQEVADGCEEESVHVVLDPLADSLTEQVHNDLTDDEEEDAKRNVSEWPSLLQCTRDQKDLHNDVDEEEDGAEDVDHNEQSDRVQRSKSCNTLESENTDSKADEEHDERADP